MKMSFLLILSSFVLILSGCYVENASSEKNKTLVIASDYLDEGDTLIFSEFAKKEKVRIIIKHLDAGTIVGEIQNNKYTHGIDLVMMKSLYSVYNLNRTDLFHSINHIKDEFQSLEPYISDKYKYVGLGIDPFVCVSNPDTNVVIRNYNDLKDTKFINLLEEEDLIPMLSPLMSKMNKVKCYDWVKSVMKNERSIDVIGTPEEKLTPVVLTTFENYSANFKKDTLLSKYTNLTFPNSSSSGTFYNLRTACITGQAQHFTSASSFVKFYLLPKNNGILNRKLNTFSITNDESNIKLYYVNSKELIQYYSMFKRILSRLS